jgi:hypothetical protein
VQSPHFGLLFFSQRVSMNPLSRPVVFLPSVPAVLPSLQAAVLFSGAPSA